MEKVCQWIMDETISHAPDKSIPSSNKGWSETLAAYRFIGHHKITPQKI